MQVRMKKLKSYFKEQNDVAMAFVFGSRAKKQTHFSSDWDIGVYFKPKEYLELETKILEYPNENKIWSDLIDILKTNDLDLVVLNRAAPSLVYNILRTGLSLKIVDRKLYLNLLCKTSYEAMDWWSFVEDYWQISEKAKSLSLEVKNQIEKWLIFLNEQFQDFERFKKITWETYRDDRNERRNIERWIENLVTPALDIAKAFLASDKREVPESYKEILKVFFGIYLDFDESLAEEFSEFAKLRNIIAHEYLDLRWEKIKKFVQEAGNLYPQFIEKTKSLIKSNR